LSRRAEVRLGEFAKEKYNMDYYVLGMFAIQITIMLILTNTKISLPDKFLLDV